MAPKAGRIEELLRAAGITAELSDTGAELRDDRWVVRLAGGIVVWVPENAAGAERLAAERDVLRLLEGRCRFRAPRVLHEDRDGSDVRDMVPGVSDPAWLSRMLKDDAKLAERVGRRLGEILAEQHQALAADEAPAWLRRKVSWPMSLEWIRERLPNVLSDAALLARLEQVLGHYEVSTIDPADRVLVHGDFGFHNIAFDPATGEVVGVFDYDEAAWDDRHHDFRYLEYEAGRTEVLDAAIAIYEARTGVHVNRARVHLLHAVSAICFLANRVGVAAETVWCGRTLVQDLAWVRSAIVGFEK